MLWSNGIYGRCVFYMLLIVDLSLWLGFNGEMFLKRCKQHKKIFEELKNYASPWQFFSFSIPFVLYCNRLNFKIHRKCWCKYKWSSTGKSILRECPFEKFMGHLKAVEAKNKIGVFRYIVIWRENIRGDQWN